MADRVFPAYGRRRETAAEHDRTIPIVQLDPRNGRLSEVSAG